MHGPGAWLTYTRAVAAIATSNAKKQVPRCITCGEPKDHVDHLPDERDGGPEFTVTSGHPFRAGES